MEEFLQRVDVKQMLDSPGNPDLDPFLVIFDRWRKQDDHPSDWVDLADYAHMPSGPGILIAGKRDTLRDQSQSPGSRIAHQRATWPGRQHGGSISRGLPPRP